MVSGYNLGNAYGRVVISDNVDQAMRNAQGAFDRGIAGMGQSMQRFGDSVTGVGARITALTAPLTAFGMTGIRAAMDFDEIMTAISARTGLVGDDLDAVRERAMQMGADTVFSATQSAQAMLEMLAAGTDIVDVMQLIEPVLMGAAAGGTDIARTADIMTNIMQVFRLEAEDGAAVIDSLTQASATSSATIDLLGEAFKSGGGAAAMAGLTFEETAAIFSMFANTGRQGAEAGTVLKSMLLGMQQPTASTQRAWAELGTTFYDAEGNMRPFPDLIDDIRAGLADKTPEEANRIMQDLAGSYGIAGLQALVAGDSINDVIESMNEQASATDVAEARMNTFKGALTSLGGSIETLQIEVFTPFMNNTLKPLIERAIEITNGITAWAKANPALASTLVMVGAGLVALGPVLMAVGIAISTMGAAVAALASPFILIAAVMAAVAAAFITDFGGIRTMLMERLTPAIEAFRERLAGLWAHVQPALEAMRAWFVADAMPQIAAIFGDFLDLVASTWETISPALFAMGEWFLTSGLPLIQQYISDVILPGIQLFVDVLAGAWKVIQPGVAALVDWFISTGLPKATTFISETVIPGISAMIDILKSIFQEVEPYITQFAEFMFEIIGDVAEFIGGLIQKVGELIDKVKEIGNLDRSGQGKGGLFGSGFGPNIDPLGGFRDVIKLFDSGGRADPNSIAHVGAAQMGREAFMVGDQGGTFYPDFASNLASLAAGVFADVAMPNRTENELSGGGQSIVINIEVPVDVLRNEPGLAGNAERLGEAIRENIRRRG